MSRIARVVVPGIAHHLTQRGNARQAVFSSDQDRRVYLEMVCEYAVQYQVRIWAYCLMENHIHLVAVPELQDSLARMLGRANGEYARFFNAHERKCGHLWQARYFSCPMDEAHAWAAMRYVERNPVRAGMVKRAEEWRWSSARAHVGEGDPTGILDLGMWSSVYDGRQWRQALETSFEEEGWRRRLEEATVRGRPLGSEGFIEELESELGRRLRPRPAGRPRKAEMGN